MSLLRPRLGGLVARLALFYLLLSLPTLVVVESALLAWEFREFRSGLAEGRLERAAERGAGELVALRGDATAVAVWLHAWTLRLQQPHGAVVPDGSYVLMELAEQPFAAALLNRAGDLVAGSADSHSWPMALPDPGERAAIAATPALHAVALAPRGVETLTRRLAVPLGERGDVLFVELRVASPWQRLFLAESFESPTVLAFLVVFGIASSIFLAAWVTRRLNRIAAAATGWSQGDFSLRIDDPSRDELGGLGRLLDRTAQDLRGLLRSRAQLATFAERQRLARDLHDTVKQKAFALNLQLASARRKLGEGSPAAESLAQAQRLTQQIQQELAEILDELRASDADLPLAERIRTRASDWAQASGIAPTFALEDIPALPAAVEESLLRIVDEALANVLRHSGADRVDIALRREAESVLLAIADNGRGGGGETASGMGLGNMRQRALALPRGRFDHDAPAGAGTRVRVRFVPTASEDSAP